MMKPMFSTLKGQRLHLHSSPMLDGLDKLALIELSSTYHFLYNKYNTDLFIWVKVDYILQNNKHISLYCIP